MSFQSVIASAILSLHRGEPLKLSEDQVSLLESLCVSSLPEAKIESPTKATIEELASMVKKPRTIASTATTPPGTVIATVAPVEPKADSPTLEIQETVAVTVAVADTVAVVETVADAVAEAVAEPVNLVATTETVVATAPVLVAPVVTNVLEVAKGLPEDPLRMHKYRIGNGVNMKKCMGRRIDDKHPIPGTSPKFFPEKQCSHGPEKGSALCKGCGEKDAEAKAAPKKAFRGWYGRLDEPMYWNANVIGCEKFNKQYPKGLPEDAVEGSATTEAPAVIEHIAESSEATKVPASPPKAEKTEKAEKPAKAPKAPVKAKEAKETKEVAPIPMAPLESTTVVAVETPPVEIVWVTIPDKGRTRIYNTKTLNVYECNLKETDREKMVQKDKFIGRYIDGKIDPTEEEAEEE
jgi:hypothetical protein